MANFLIGKGLSISKNSFGQTPILIVGVVGLNKKMVEFYISQGADVNEEFGGKTALGMALLNSKTQSSEAKKQEAQEIADLLRQHGAKKR
jgi:ankyrin repeat protein